MSKKRGRSIKINIKMSNRLLYTLILIGILIVIGIGVYAESYIASGAGHPYTEISTCAANQSLKMNAAGTAWTCSDDVAGITKEYADANYKDPPGQWTCTLRTGSGSSSATATCVGNEKVINGGCRVTSASGFSYVLSNRPTSDGWICTCYSSSTCGTLTAYAYCCL